MGVSVRLRRRLRHRIIAAGLLVLFALRLGDGGLLANRHGSLNPAAAAECKDHWLAS